MKKDKSKSTKTRYYLIDAIRAVTMISMIAFHGFYDYIVFSGTKIDFHHGFVFYWEQSICWTFILISGMCRCIGHKSLRRGLIVSGCGLATTLFTYFVLPDELIIFGVLTCIGACMLLCIPLEKLIDKVNPIAGMTVSFLIFAIIKNMPQGFIGFFNLRLADIPRSLYANVFTAFLGLPSPTFHSADYFPIFPWFFLFLTGCFLWKTIDKKIPKAKEILTFKVPFLSAFGKYSLFVYVVHQGILYGAFTLIYTFLIK